ncbi:MAG: glycosyltransferase family 9 protein [Pseudomonadota bacterium]
MAPLAETVSSDLPAALLLHRLDIKKLVVFRALQVGDMLCAVPTLRSLRAGFPEANITLVSLPWAKEFAARFNNYLDDFVAFPGHPQFPEQPAQESTLPTFYQEMRARHFDLAVQIHGNGQISNQIINEFGAKIRVGFTRKGSAEIHSRSFPAYPETGAEPLRLLTLTTSLGTPFLGTDLEFPLTADDFSELNASGIASGLTEDNYICIHAGARIRSKCWAPTQFAKVGDQLSKEFGLPIVLTGSGKEMDLTAAVAAQMQTKAINAASPISIGAMAALMSGARLLICNDTGVSHIAAGLKLPSVVIFSTADMTRWAPLNHILHRCISDPNGEKAAEIIEQARCLLTAHGKDQRLTP